jgi:hypothetical protein
MTHRPVSLGLLWVLAAAPAPAQTPAEPFPGLDAYVTKAMADW